MGYCDSNSVVRQLQEEGGGQSGAGNFASRELTEPELGLVSAVGLPWVASPCCPGGTVEDTELGVKGFILYVRILIWPPSCDQTFV